MDPRTQERVEQWDSRPFSGGYDGLSDLADADFTGAVTATGTWLFMLNGRVVGVIDGEIEDFEAASGTAYEAPDPALPLLCTMEERGGETRAKYYTNETPLREVDETLQSGSFTGYVELSENVLSGDYYAVYYGGRRMAAAYIGNAERLLTGEEAFERAADEVGIYEVRDVEIDVTDVPGADADASGTAADADAGADSDGASSPSAGAESSAGGNAGAEPSVDPTESAIDSIDISGSDAAPDSSAPADDDGVSAPIEDVTIGAAAGESESADGAEATEPTGITATDDAAPQSEPASSGITDAEAVEAAAAVDDADEPSPATDERAQSAGTAAPAERTAGEREGSTDETEQSPATEPETDSESGATSGSGPDPAEVEAAAQQLEQSDISWTEDDVESSDAATTGGTESSAAGATAGASAEPEPTESEPTDERFDEEAQWRETRSIPSIDPDNSQSSDSSRDGGRSEAQQAQSRRGAGAGRSGRGADAASGSSGQRSAQRQTQEASAARGRGPQRADRADTGAGAGASAGGSGSATADASAADERVAELAQRIEALEEQRDELAAKAEELEAERERLQSENEELSSTVDRLQSRIEELEAELERAREAGDAGEAEVPAASTQLPPERALAETNLFVRYASKSQPTLESAHDGEGDRTEVAANLRLEHHTGFDAADVAVDGRPYEEFLPETMEHRFVQWLTEMVLFEIRDTGNADGLGDLYDAIPRIDRAELDATISLEDDDTEDVPDQVTFDVVAFDKMGSPLVVANLNDSREPATQGMLEEMEEAASAVKANYADLAAAVVVTSSYFEPGALEVAEQATSGGLLSRGSKLSYVNLSRKQGYHLCLVESRSEGFHMNVPEL